MLGMSGGVDSSAAALLLLRDGWDVCGVTLLLTPDAAKDSTAAADAAAVCKKLGIEHRCVDMRGKFRRDVMDYFAAEYAAGRTPNPCVQCNRTVKFGAMLDYARSCGIDYIATGHYARIQRDDASGKYALMRADSAKDQSYVLWQLTQEQLMHTVFPLAGAQKSELRLIAEHAGIETASKKDSQDICFIPDGDYVRFLCDIYGQEYPEGDFVDIRGAVIGRHKGINRYTIGQRKGLGGGFAAPMYVVAIDAPGNRVVLGQEGSQYCREIRCEHINMISGDPLASPVEAQVKVRYSAPAASAVITPLGEGTASVAFDLPARAPTPGQSAVFYSGDTVLGGGIISATRNTYSNI